MDSTVSTGAVPAVRASAEAPSSAPAGGGIYALFPPASSPLGQTPLRLRGTLPLIHGEIIFNGPASFGKAGFRYKHWLDGDGLIQVLSFGPTPTLRTAFVGTRKKSVEDAAGRPVFRTFGTRFPGDQVSLNTGIETSANVSVTPWQGMLLASGEGAPPYRLDNASLETLGQWDDQGRVGPFQLLSAHPKICRQTGSMFNFSMNQDSNGDFIRFWEFTQTPGLPPRTPALESIRIPLEHAYSVHDFAITENYLLLVLHPHVVDRSLMMQKGRTVLESLRWRRDLPTQLLVVPRAAPSEWFFSEIPVGYVIHWIDAKEDGEELVLDLVEYEGPIYQQLLFQAPLYGSVPPGQCRRVRFHLATRTVLGSQTTMSGMRPDFPAHCGEEFWCLGMDRFRDGEPNFFDQILHGSFATSRPDSMSRWIGPPGEFLCGEPILIGGRSGGDRFIAVQYGIPSLQERGLHVFVADHVEAGPVCSLLYPEPTPFGLHGFWREEFEGTSDESLLETVPKAGER